MKMKLLAVAALVVAFAIPALAATKFYVVQDKVTTMCSIVETKPTIKTKQVVGKVYKTKKEAEMAMKEDGGCSG